MQMLTGFAPLAARYDGFILDLWGVIHDGVSPYPGAVEVLKRLRAAGKPAVLLSNAPRRAHVAQLAMRGMGIADALYTGILTSGEVTYRMLRDRTDPFFAALGTRVYHLGPERDRNVIEGLDCERVRRPAQADFVLNTGPDDERSPTDLADCEDELQACLRGRPADDLRQPRPGSDPRRRAGDLRRAADPALRGARRHRPLGGQAGPGGLRAGAGPAGAGAVARAGGGRLAAHRYRRGGGRGDRFVLGAGGHPCGRCWETTTRRRPTRCGGSGWRRLPRLPAFVW